MATLTDFEVPPFIIDTGGPNATAPGSTGTVTNPTVIDPGVPGNPTVITDFSNVSPLQAGQINFDQALESAFGAGAKNLSIFLDNIKAVRESALSVLDTDILGIKRAVGELSPLARSEGNKDTQTNIDRAKTIDQFNFSRIPGFNEFNRAEKAKNTAATGIDYKDRINKVLGQLDAQSEGRFTDKQIDSLFSATARNRGADIASSAGIGARSGIGSNIQKDLDINQRINLIQNAQQQIPGVAGQAQQLLETPTIFAQPTEVPLNVSNIGDKIPITSNISAGQTQIALAQEANRLNTIPSSQILNSNISAQSANAQLALQADKANQDVQIGIATSEANAIQQGLNADKADEIRNQNQQAFQDALDTRSNSELIGAGTQVVGGLLGSIFSQPTPLTPEAQPDVVAGPVQPGSSASNGFISDIINGVGSGIDSIVSGIGSLFKRGAPTVGGSDIPTSGVLGPLPQTNTALVSNSDINSFLKTIPAVLTKLPSLGFVPSGQSEDKASVDFSGPFKTIVENKGDPQARYKSVSQGISLVANWSKLNGGQKAAGVFQTIGGLLGSNNVLPESDLKYINQVGSGLTTIANPNVSTKDKSLAVASLVNTYGNNDPFSKNVLNAAALLSTDATTDQKIKGLMNLGLDVAQAQGILETAENTGPLAVLSLLNSGKNFDQMNPLQKTTAVYNAAYTVAQAFGSSLAASAPPVAGVTAALTTGYLQYEGFKDIAKGKSPGLIESAALFPITGGLDQLIDPVGKAFGGGANDRNIQQRDSAKYLASLSPATNGRGFGVYTDPKGNVIEISNNPLNPKGNKLHSFAVEQSDPLGTALAVQMIKGGYKVKSGGFKALATDLSTKLAGAFVSTSGNQKEINASRDAFLSQYGMDRNTLYSNILSLAENPPKGVTKAHINSMLAGIDRIFGIKNPNQGKGGSEEFPLGV